MNARRVAELQLELAHAEMRVAELRAEVARAMLEEPAANDPPPKPKRARMPAMPRNLRPPSELDSARAVAELRRLGIPVKP